MYFLWLIQDKYSKCPICNFISFANLIWILPLHCPKDNRFSVIEHEIEKKIILRGIFHVVSRFPVHFLLYHGNLDYFSDSVQCWFLSSTVWWSYVDISVLSLGPVQSVMVNRELHVRNRHFSESFSLAFFPHRYIISTVV